ncbi:MAG TPA: hypothetical protein VN429_09455 [Methanospirillum sp.]|jgi:hypothetical protein|uniref:hypothetical protein n=1 Tax=Methanospirillum sp. TaxID=45200 RepID=UPI002C8C53E6|nr:hypothetical protein [Methanospirillum sp.]HWQ64628.1 hypothetical protein [Methanospirillum sp.]
MTGTNLTARSTLYHAGAELNRAGYHFLRIAGSGRLFDFVAWTRKKIIFVTVKRTRKGDISRFSDEVQEIASFLSENPLPGMVQFWIFSSSSWLIYQILPGGALRIRGGIHESLR